MRTLLVLLATLPLAAQAPPGPQVTKPAETKPAETRPQEAQPAKPEEAKAESPSPVAEKWFTGALDFGYRWVGNIGGDFNTYRSVVNLGEGPKLLNLEATIQPPSRRFADRIDVHANSWGGDPYNTARIDARKERLYNFTWDYRNIAYFNFLPSFADPTKERGQFLDQRSFDTFRRTSSFELDLLPGRWITPYVAYERNGGRGQGITNFVLQANEYTIPTRFSDHTNQYRGGLRFEFSRFHATVEQGALSFRDEQQVFSGQPGNPGNLTTPFFGQRLFLNTARQDYGVHGDALFSRALVTASPFSWLNLYGQFLYSQPKTKTHFTQAGTGNFFDSATLAFYSGQTSLLDARAAQPHPSGSFSLELKPLPRLRIFESIMTDRLHDSTSALLTDQLLQTGGTVVPTNVFAARQLVLTYNQQELNVLSDLSSKWTLRAGQRYIWGDASNPGALVLAGQGITRETGKLRRNVALAGTTFRWGQRFSTTVDFEASSGDREYFRTSLHEYQKGRIQARFQPLPSLQVSANVSVLNNQNPSTGVRYDFLSRQNTVSVFFSPAGGKRLSILGEYGRSTLRSDINYLVPNLPTVSERSFYRDNAHTGTALVDIPLPTPGVQPKLSFGGSFFVSSGTRPARYYQPLARFSLPIGKYAQWNSEWRWYAFTQPFYLYEGFRSHQFVTGFRLMM